MVQNLLNMLLSTNSKRIDIKQLEQLLIDGLHADSDPESKHIKKKSFAPSTIGNGHGACGRYWWYAFEGTDSFKRHNVRGTTALRVGTDSHTRLQRLLETAGILRESEKQLKHDDPPILGYMDAIIEFNDRPIVVEIKTMKQELFQQLSTSGPPRYHMTQLLLYMHILQIDNGLLWYENKNNGDWHFVQLYMDDRHTKHVQAVLQWLQTTYSVWKEGEKPRRQFNKSSKQCKYCPFLQTCWAARPDDGINKLQEFPVI